MGAVLRGKPRAGGILVREGIGGRKGGVRYSLGLESISGGGWTTVLILSIPQSCPMPQRTLLSLTDSDRRVVVLEVIPPFDAMRAHISQKDGMRFGKCRDIVRRPGGEEYCPQFRGDLPRWCCW